MTVHAIDIHKRECLMAGMDDYLAKPITPQTLARTLQRWISAESEVNEGEPERGSREDAPKGTSSLPVFDHSGLLKRLMGDTQIANIIIQGFLADIPNRFSALHDALEAGDAAWSQLHTHAIKGAAANVGAEQLRVLASDLEMASKAGDLDSVKTRMNTLTNTFETLQATLQTVDLSKLD
jgi:HPt (histidine-containing phosphotransfer) domain-containing protein